MPPKRATKTLGSTKRSQFKNVLDSDSEVESARPQKLNRTTSKPTDDDSDDEERLVRPSKTQQPKPRKKTSNSLVATDATATTQKSLPATLVKQSSVLKSKKDAQFQLENQENRALGSKTPAVNDTLFKRSSRPVPAMSSEELAEALEELNVKYKNLRHLRVTEAERHLEDCRQKLDEVTQSAENYRAQIEPQLESSLRMQEKLRDNSEVMNAKVRTLQKQVREYEQKLKQRDLDDKVKARTDAMESVLASPDTTPSSAASASIIHMFENMTGLKVIPRNLFSARGSKQGDPMVWDCEHSGPVGTLRFTLTYEKDSDMVTYTPILDQKKDAELLRKLPEYLTVEIEFEKAFEAKLFWRILNFNNEVNS